MPIEIETTTYCPNAFTPRWTWWIRGISGTSRYGIVGTNEFGMGLYLYHACGDHIPSRALLLDENAFCVLDSTSKAEATSQLIAALGGLGWGSTHEAQI